MVRDMIEIACIKLIIKIRAKMLFLLFSLNKPVKNNTP